MPKRFAVQLGRLVREVLHVVVEVPDDKDEAWLTGRLNEVYAEAQGDEFDDEWEEDTEWGCEEFDSHAVYADVDVTGDVNNLISLNAEDDEDQPKESLFLASVTETRTYISNYVVSATDKAQATDKAVIGDTEEEYNARFTGVVDRVINEIAPYEMPRVTPQALQTQLLLVDVEVGLDVLAAWSQEWLDKASAWAIAVHLKAGDNDDVVVPECPYYVPPDEHDKQYAQEEPKTEWGWLTAKYKDGGSFKAPLFLPGYVNRERAMRFAYWQYKGNLDLAVSWDVSKLGG